MKKEIKNVTINAYVKDVENGKLSLDVSVQRGDDKWTTAQRSKLVEAVLKDYPIPPICIATFEGKKIVYDGLQRTTALRKFCNDVFALESVDAVWCGKNFSELDEEDKKKFLEYELTFMDAGEVSAEELTELFLNLNNGTALTKTQKTRGHLGHTVAEWAKKMCSQPLFTKLAKLTEAQLKADAPLECLLQGILLIHGCLGNSDGERFEWKNISRDEVQKYSAEVLAKASASELEEYAQVIEYLNTADVTNNYEKTFIPSLIVLGKYAMLSGVSNEEFNHYVEHLRNNLPKGYGIFKGAGSVSKAKTVGKIKVLIDDFNEKFPDVKKPEINLDSSRKKATKKTSKKEEDAVIKKDATVEASNGVADTDVNSDASIRVEEDVADTASEETLEKLSQKIQVVG